MAVAAQMEEGQRMALRESKREDGSMRAPYEQLQCRQLQSEFRAKYLVFLAKRVKEELLRQFQSANISLPLRSMSPMAVFVASIGA